MHRAKILPLQRGVLAPLNSSWRFSQAREHGTPNVKDGGGVNFGKTNEPEIELVYIICHLDGQGGGHMNKQTKHLDSQNRSS